MKNIEKLLKKVEDNFHKKDERKTKEFKIGDETYEVLLPTRSEAIDILFSKKIKQNETMKDMYEWLKPHIYRMFQLKDLSVKAKENGFINSYYEIIDMLFSPDEIGEIISFIMETVSSKHFLDKELEFQKKQ